MATETVANDGELLSVRSGDEIYVSGNRRMRVRAVIAAERMEEFVDRRALYGVLEVEPVWTSNRRSKRPGTSQM